MSIERDHGIYGIMKYHGYVKILVSLIHEFEAIFFVLQHPQEQFLQSECYPQNSQIATFLETWHN